ncbi:DMT family transporter [Nonomuraea soli]|uniref:Drug/metabolite transporter (DMT)-like permease n=1 Tax=Nonomuraea soli TaxID=1032476 RepID=A0A7W0HV37_9ACTN|nr:DMT family transporter [Nonomuraea soli]MBA2896755.1 drug/metabolite transporter (DMT)-like permease [Nonomuraea soli]
MQISHVGRWLPAFLVLAAIWGNSFFFIKIAVGSLHPLQVSFGRMLIGASVLLVVLFARRLALPRDPRLWGHFQVVSVVATTVPFTLFGYGEQYVSSVVAAIWNATTPLCTLAFTLLLGSEKATAARMTGLGLGFAGVMVVLGVWQPLQGGQLAGSLACFGAAASYGVGGAYMGRFLTGRRSEPPMVLATGQLVSGTVQLAVITLVAGVPLVDLSVPAPVWWSLLALGGLGTGLAYLLLYWVQARAGVTTTSTVTYLLPVFATVSGVVFLGESLSWNQPVGALIVLGAIAVTQGLIRPRSRRHLAAVTD